MCITELRWRGAYTGQSAEIKPNSKALPLSRLSHEVKGYILLATQPEPGLPSHLRQPGWHTALQSRSLGDTQPCSPAVVPSLASVAGCWLPCWPWDETPPRIRELVVLVCHRSWSMSSSLKVFLELIQGRSLCQSSLFHRKSLNLLI